MILNGPLATRWSGASLVPCHVGPGVGPLVSVPAGQASPRLAISSLMASFCFFSSATWASSG